MLHRPKCLIESPCQSNTILVFGWFIITTENSAVTDWCLHKICCLNCVINDPWGNYTSSILYSFPIETHRLRGPRVVHFSVLEISTEAWDNLASQGRFCSVKVTNLTHCKWCKGPYLHTIIPFLSMWFWFSSGWFLIHLIWSGPFSECFNLAQPSTRKLDHWSKSSRQKMDVIIHVF